MSSGSTVSVLEVLAGMVGGGALAKLVEAVMKGRTPKKDVMTAVAEAADLLMDGMREDLNVLRGALATQASEIAALKAENVECRAEGEQLRQQARGLEQRLDSLLRQLRDPAATQPGGSLSGALIEMSGGDVTVSRPARKPE